MEKLPAETLRAMRVVAGGLMAGPVVLFGAAGLVRFLGTVPPDVPIVMYVAIALALLSPVVAGAMRARMTLGFAAAFLLTPTYWPLLAALVPLGSMALWFPRQ